MTFQDSTTQVDYGSPSVDIVVVQGAYVAINDHEPGTTIGIRSRWAPISLAVASTAGSPVEQHQPSLVEVRSPFADLFRFRELAREWKSRRSASSSITEITHHPAYQKIIGMGESAVPLILRELEREGRDPAHWFWALHAISLEQPVSHQDRGNTVRMAKAWLEWGKNRGYEW